MTDPSDTPPETPAVAAARRALEMKRAAKTPPAGPANRKGSERDAAARSAAKSKPALRK